MSAESMPVDVGCDWTMADVTRALHSVAKVAGPKGDGDGKHEESGSDGDRASFI